MPLAGITVKSGEKNALHPNSSFTLALYTPAAALKTLSVLTITLSGIFQYSYPTNPCGNLNGTVVLPSGEGTTLLRRPFTVIGGVTVVLRRPTTTGLGDQSDQLPD